jgi:hypothetical protein
MLFKNSVRTSKRTPHFTITNLNWLTLFREIIAVYCKYHMKPTTTFCGQTAQLAFGQVEGATWLHGVDTLFNEDTSIFVVY